MVKETGIKTVVPENVALLLSAHSTAVTRLSVVLQTLGMPHGKESQCCLWDVAEGFWSNGLPLCMIPSKKTRTALYLETFTTQAMLGNLFMLHQDSCGFQQKNSGFQPF